MLSGHFYETTEFSASDASIDAAIELNPAHPIFAGHFPGQPVVPGVCMLQIVKEMTERKSGRPLFLGRARNVKFMNLIDPRRNARASIHLDLQTDGNGVAVSGKVFAGELVFLKCDLHFSSGSGFAQ